jgi:PHD/YefM family antitoxin component YafN of YafNO toxin-antitoxin module
MIVKQMDVRSNIRKYFDIAYEGEAVIVPRKQDHNVVIISEAEYNKLMRERRLNAYAQAVGGVPDRKKRIISERGSDLRSHNADKLSAIRAFKPGWNGNGAPAFAPGLIDTVGTLVGGLDIQPEVFPTAMGTIQLEYDNSRHDHMEIEIADESPEAEVFTVKFNGEEEYGYIPASADAINDKVLDFYG